MCISECNKPKKMHPNRERERERDRERERERERETEKNRESERERENESFVAPSGTFAVELARFTSAIFRIKLGLHTQKKAKNP